MTATADARPRTRFRDVFATAEFRPLFGTFLLSTAGDELARIALTVLVYQRTSSPLLSALTFAIGHLPWLLGGPLLAAFADRLPRHRVLIGADVVRGILLVGMAIPGTPLPVLLALLFLVSLCAPPFESARSALMADVLEGDRYALASSLSNTTLQLAQVVGFLAGGALVAVLNPSAALLIDAATFGVSALWLSIGLNRRPAPVAQDGEGPRSLWQDTADGLRLIGRSPRLLAIIGILWAGTLFGFAFEGVAAPLVEDLGTGTTVSIGILLSANPVGMTIGGLAIARLMSADLRERLVVPLVVLSLLPLLAGGLVAVLAGPGTLSFAVVVALLFVSGLGAAWTIPLNVSFVAAVPNAYRGRAFGVAVSGLYGVQALGAIAAGLVAEGISAAAVLALSGGVGLLAVVPALVAYRRTQGSVAAAAGGEGPSEA
jgi:MFS family permease